MEGMQFPGAGHHAAFEIRRIVFYLLHEPRMVHRPVKNHLQFKGLKGFLDEVVGALLQGVNRRVHGRESRDDHTEGQGIFFANGAEQFQTRKAGHFQVREDDRIVLFSHHGQGRFAAVGLFHGIAVLGKSFAKRAPHSYFIVHEKNGLGDHGASRGCEVVTS